MSYISKALQLSQNINIKGVDKGRFLWYNIYSQVSEFGFRNS